MTTGTITGTVDTPVVLGSGQYGRTLTIAAAGAVEPAIHGAAAITAPSSLTSAIVMNDGVLAGALGAPSQLDTGGQGGDSILLQTNGYVGNAGSITGGAGGYASEDAGGAGGIGADLRRYGRVVNSGTITGGAGNTNLAFGVSGNGGVGVDLRLGGDITNRGVIDGGSGGYGSLQAGNGAAGLVLGEDAKVVNSGTIAGGAGGYSMQTPGYGADAVDFLKGGTLLNHGLIQGAAYAGAGVSFGGSALLANTGTIEGGADNAAVLLSFGGSVINGGAILGGGGFYGEETSGGSGRQALAVAGAAAILNTGVLDGGGGGDSQLYGGGAGGDGVSLSAAAEGLTNRGAIVGGSGGTAGYDNGGAGGVGVYVGQQSRLTNLGTITGGAGGANLGSNNGISGDGGIGGAGVSVGGGTVLNRGVITGGAGGAASVYPGSNGGVGVYLHAGELIAASGTISGGAAAANTSGPAQGYAVLMGPDIGATLLVDPGAVFIGGIEASYSVDDKLVLGDGGAGTLTGFGETGGISGFSSIEENAGAHWTLAGTITSNTPIILNAHDFLALGGSDQFVPVDFATAGNDVLRLDTPSTFANSTLVHFGSGDIIQLEGIAATSFTFKGDELTLIGSDGATLTTLYIPSRDTQADFGIKLIPGGTEVYWAGGTSTAQDLHTAWLQHFSVNL